MDSPLKTKQTTTYANPKKSGGSALAMDITRDNRVAYNLDSEVYFAPRSGDAVKGWDAYHAMDGDRTQMFSPHRIQLDDRSKRALLLSPAMKSHVSVFDVERGKNIAELQVKNMVADIDMNIRTMTPAKKFAQLHDSPSVVREYGVGDNMVFTVHHDMRTRPVPLVIKEKDKQEVKTKGLNYTAVVTTSDGDVAVGTSNGDIKLYSNPEIDGWKQPKNSFTQLQADGHTVTGLDVSYDGEWLLWTTATKIALLRVKFDDPKSGQVASAFKTRCPEELRPSAMILTLHKDTLANHGMSSLHFTPAKFDASTAVVEITHGSDSPAAQVAKSSMLEQSVVTSSGPFLISWNFRQLKADYIKLNKKNEARIETTVVPHFTKLQSDIMATQFEYWNAPTEELSRLTLK